MAENYPLGQEWGALDDPQGQLFPRGVVDRLRARRDAGEEFGVALKAEGFDG